MTDATPIVAIATAPGRGGVGIVRVSGAGIERLLPRLLIGTGAHAAPIAALTARQARHACVVDRDGAVIDEVIAIWFTAPASFTGQHVLELHGHGGPVVLGRLVRRVVEAGQDLGVRLARAGEFTERAFLNDKLDLAQAEAVADLIDAATDAAAAGAVRSLRGEFSAAVQALVERLIELRALVEATLDFPEEEIDFLNASDARGRLAELDAQCARLLADAGQGALLRDGVTAVIAGAPNVGKSSLMNALAGEDVAIVTPVAGTTRDRIERLIALDGVPILLIDTAGLRESDDAVEQIGIARSWQAIDGADLVLWLSAADQPGVGGQADDPIVARVNARVPAHAKRIMVRNKIDLTGEPGGYDAAQGIWRISAQTGAGVDTLRLGLLEAAGWRRRDGESLFIARERHLQALRGALAELHAAAGHAAQGDRALELFAEALRTAQMQLAAITGEFSADDLLGEIFGRFCIGK